MNSTELRELLAESEKPKSGKGFWLAVLAMPIAGVLIGLASTQIIPAKGAAPSPELLAEQDQKPPQKNLYLASFSPEAEMRKYESTLRNIKKCYIGAGYERTKVAERSYLNSNKRRFEKLDELAETLDERRDRRFTEINENNKKYSTKTGIMVAAITGEMQRDALNRAEMFADLNFTQREGSELRTKTGCLRFFAEISQGKFDIKIPDGAL